LLELTDCIQQLHGRRPEVYFEDWRTGDQRYYVSDIRKFMAATGWSPLVSARQGVGNLYNWLMESRGLGAPRLAAAPAGVNASIHSQTSLRSGRAGGMGTDLGCREPERQLPFGAAHER
jgi:hypothetical protein